MDAPIRSIPKTRNAMCAIELQTGAVSSGETERALTGLEIFGASPDNPEGNSGTRVYIESLNRQITVNDVGGGVQKYQIDVYAGLEGGAADLSLGNHSSQVWRLERVE